MSETENVSIRLRLLNPQGQPLGGAVDVDFKPQGPGQMVTVKAASASKDIDVSGLQRTPQGLYQLTVTPTDVFKPASQFVSIPASGFHTLEIVIDRGAPEPGSPAGAVMRRVIGTVRDNFHRPMVGVIVKVFDKDIRSEQPLGRPASTAPSGAYQVTYSDKEFAATDLLTPDIVVRVYGRDEKLLKESTTFYNAPQILQVDIDLSDQSYAGPSEFEQTVQTITPFIGKLLPSELTEDQKTQDITFLANKTGLTRSRIEAFAMAFRFEKNTQLQAGVYYGLILKGASTSTLTQPTANSVATSFDSKATATLAVLMRQNADSLISAIQGAIEANIIPYSLSGEIDYIRKQLVTAQQRYFQSNPEPSSSSSLTLKLSIAGLRGDQIAAFRSLFSGSSGTQQEFWKTLAKTQPFRRRRSHF
jgi:hypothetical protein